MSSACATKTLYERCQAEDNLSKLYGNMDNCIREKAREDAIDAANVNAFTSGFKSGYDASSGGNKYEVTNCSSDGFGGFNCRTY